MIERRLAATAASPYITHSLPPGLERAVQILCNTYETLDLRIETTLAAAETDFLAALPEIDTHKTELKEFVGVLIRDLRAQANGAQSQPVLLRLSFQDEGDLTQQILSTINTNGDEQ